MNSQNDHATRNTLIGHIDGLLNKAGMYHSGNEKAHLKELLGKEKYEHLVDITIVECHVIDCIERNPLINAVGISQKMNVTKGGISKITAKLLKKGLIQIYRMEGNKKEIFYSLTPLGKEVFIVHEQLHTALHQRFDLLLGRYSDAELNIISTFLKDFSEMVESV